eukprot:m51a1_g2804 hypothetical protein (308) ;mRNA; f:97381-98304
MLEGRTDEGGMSGTEEGVDGAAQASDGQNGLVKTLLGEITRLRLQNRETQMTIQQLQGVLQQSRSREDQLNQRVQYITDYINGGQNPADGPAAAQAGQQQLPAQAPPQKALSPTPLASAMTPGGLKQSQQQPQVQQQLAQLPIGGLNAAMPLNSLPGGLFMPPSNVLQVGAYLQQLHNQMMQHQVLQQIQALQLQQQQQQQQQQAAAPALGFPFGIGALAGALSGQPLPAQQQQPVAQQVAQQAPPQLKQAQGNVGLDPLQQQQQQQQPQQQQESVGSPSGGFLGQQQEATFDMFENSIDPDRGGFN